MRLVLITNDYPPKPGGIQQYLANLVGAIDAEVLVLAPSDRRASRGTSEGVRVERHKRRFMWPTPSVRRWIMNHVTEFGPDAVLFGAPYPLAWLASRIGSEGIPTGVVCHGAEITVPAAIPVARSLLRRSLRGADALLVVSRFTGRRVQRLTDRKPVYIGSGVDAAMFSPSAEERATRRTPVVGCVSRFVPRKGQHRLIKAAARLGDRGRDVDLLFVGSGRRLGSLRRLARRLEVPARFEVDVPWARLPGLYREMDIFCMPCRSRWGGLEIEGLGIVYLEAAASGLPVLAGDSGGAPETVSPAETGFVVHSVDDIVEGLDMLLGDPQRAASMGAAGRSYVAAEFTWPGVAERALAALKQPE